MYVHVFNSNEFARATHTYPHAHGGYMYAYTCTCGVYIFAYTIHTKNRFFLSVFALLYYIVHTYIMYGKSVLVVPLFSPGFFTRCHLSPPFPSILSRDKIMDVSHRSCQNLHTHILS